MQALCMLPQSLWVHLCAVLLSLEGLHSISSALMLSLSPLPKSSALRRGIWWETFLLGLSVPQSFTFCILSVSGSMYLFISAAEKKSYSNNGWARHGSMSTAECHLESCIAMFISQSSSAWFSPRPLACLVSDSWLPKQNWVWLLSHEVGLSSN